MPSHTNSRESRVRPIFTWLRDHGGDEWPRELLRLAGEENFDPGRVLEVRLDPEERVAPSRERLTWMLRRADALKATGKTNVEELKQRAKDKTAIAAVLDAPDAPIAQELILEGHTSADCVIRCENLLIWIEGKRTDKLSAGTAYDSKRDQVARNLEAAWRLAKGADFRVIICSEGPLDANEMALVDGYRDGTLTDGFPHLDAKTQRLFRDRLLLLRWGWFPRSWPELAGVRELHDLEPAHRPIPEAQKPVWLSGLDDETLARLALDLTTVICRPSFGAASKRDIEIALFSLLYPKRPEWSTIAGVAEDLAISRTKARALVLEYHNRRVGEGGRGQREKILSEAVRLWPTRPIGQHDEHLKVVVDDPFIRDLLKNFAYSRGIPIEWSFSGDIVMFKWNVYAALMTHLRNRGRKMTLDEFLNVSEDVRVQLKQVAVVNAHAQSSVSKFLQELEKDIADAQKSKGEEFIKKSKALVEKWGPVAAGLAAA